jgi:hypothetical protein
MAIRPRANPTIERKIHFYRVDAGINGGGQPVVFDARPQLTTIAALPFTNEVGGRYMVDEDGNAIGVWPDVTANRTALRFGQIRRMGLPQVERAGTVGDLDIAADAGLLEPVHVVFLGENIVGADFNFYGPRMSRLGYYLRTKSGGNGPPLQFLPLLRNNVAQQLNRFDEIKLFDLRIRAAYADVIRQADVSLGDAFLANGRVLDGDGEDIQLILRPAKNGRRNAFQRLAQPIRNLVGRGDFRENAERFQVKGRIADSRRTDLIDLLHDQLVTTKQVLRVGQRSRAVQAESAYIAIESAYAEMRNDLQLAAGLVQ